ncbi:MAG: AI-2E family transporter [Hyphomicrobiales bacterium]|nr:AI-2E family transporter [Hyphomicrobiales bacterium]
MNLASRVEVSSPFSGPTADLGRRARATDTAIIGVVVVAGLYFARDVLVPMALAVLLSFVLSPFVDRLIKLRVGRAASVFLAVGLAILLLFVLGAVIGRQVSQLTDQLPAYQAVIAHKLETLRSSTLGAHVVQKAADALEGLGNSTTGPANDTQASGASGAKLMQVEVHEPPPGPVQIVQSVLGALFPPLATAAVVVVFVVFILLQRSDLRDRLIRLVGSHDLHRTTEALDEAARRLSQYFLALTGINAAFGAAIGTGLYFIGVPNPALWGIVGAVLRFIPYVGALIAVAIPLALAAAVDPGWRMMAETALLYVVLEGFMGQIVEPRLFGHTTGMSPLAIIVAASFWTLLWGPPGLLLSTPITACLVVLGRHVESLNFIELLLGDRPALSPIQSFYQRALASDADEVAYQAEELLKGMPLLRYFQDVALPALAMAQRDASRGVLDRDRQLELYVTVEKIVSELAGYRGSSTAVGNKEVDVADVGQRLSSPRPFSVLCVAGRTAIDSAAALIVAQILQEHDIQARASDAPTRYSPDFLSMSTEDCDAICLVYLNAESIAPLRYAIRRLRVRDAKLPVCALVFGDPLPPSTSTRIEAEERVATLEDVVSFCEKEAAKIARESAEAA